MTADVAGSAAPTPDEVGAAPVPPRLKGRGLLTRRDWLVLALLLGIPLGIHVFLVWLPTLFSIVLSFTSWNGIGGLDRIKFVGIDNYRVLVTTYPPFWPAITHNLIWLGVFLFIATPIGILFAVLWFALNTWLSLFPLLLLALIASSILSIFVRRAARDRLAGKIEHRAEKISHRIEQARTAEDDD